MNILGINLYHANAAAALVCDGQLVAAAEEERFSRVKYAAGFPAHAIRYCLQAAGLTARDLDHVIVPRDPRARWRHKLQCALRLPRFALERARVLARLTGLREELAATLGVAPDTLRARFHRVEHHRAHLASAYLVSPFDQAALLSADGLGDFGSAMWGVGTGPRLQIAGEAVFPHSLGLFYTAVTQYLGFWKFGDEYKVMGLAAYGEPVFRDEFRRILQAGPGLQFRLELDYFLHHRQGAEMSWESGKETPVLGRLFSPLFEQRLGPARRPEEPLEQRHRDIAASLQEALEEALFTLLEALHRQTGLDTLCMAGGVAFNCVANGKLFRRTPFRRLYIQPAAGDAGLAVGAAYYLYHHILGRPRSFVMDHAYWGPEFRRDQLLHAIESRGLGARGFLLRELAEPELIERTAELLAAGAIVGWFQGRMEWGPRALGNRSILADPRRPEMKDILNRRIKHREPFRPFAPAILEEATSEYFDAPADSPFMLLAFPARPESRDRIPAPIHVDGTGRLQTVSRQTNPRFWALLEAFAHRTGVPVLLNTSFNENEPIVCHPEEAVDCFLRTHMDALVLGDLLIEKPAHETGASQHRLASGF